MSELYYTAPTDKQFEEVKDKSIEIWKTYDDTFGYATEKIGVIKDMKNISDNLMYMIAMFDITNQQKLSQSLSEETRLAVRERMIDGGSPEEYIVF